MRQQLYAYRGDGEVVCDGIYEGSGSIGEFLISAVEASKNVPCGSPGNPQYSQEKRLFVILGATPIGSLPKYSFLPTVMRLHRWHVKWYTKAKIFVSGIGRRTQ